jgi:hypothetical protein
MLLYPYGSDVLVPVVVDRNIMSMLAAFLPATSTIPVLAIRASLSRPVIGGSVDDYTILMVHVETQFLFNNGMIWTCISTGTGTCALGTAAKSKS